MCDEERVTVDLAAYTTRLGYTGNVSPTLATFKALHLAHNLHIPFENLDILLGLPIKIDLPSIQLKLVRNRRGGYCFEHNRLFAAVLETIGLPTTFLAARVRYRSHRLLPRTHVLLLVEIDGTSWIGDVGFGTAGLLEPIPLQADRSFEQYGWTYRLVEEPGLWILQTLQANEWQSLYAFSLEPQFLPDLEVANHYISTHPQSRFVQTLVAQRSTLTRRLMLRNFDLIIDDRHDITTTALSGPDELLRILREQFDLPFPVETRFSIPSLE
jgi:N-hydroxyarylamine O-acetyltransferase